MTSELFAAGLISEAADDQQCYLKDGDPKSDYGQEWPGIAGDGAGRFRPVPTDCSSEAAGAG
jgi:hypothetical protein